MTVGTLPMLFAKPPDNDAYSTVTANTVNDWVAVNGAGEFGEAFGMQEEVAEEFAVIVGEHTLIAGPAAGVEIAAGAGHGDLEGVVRQWRVRTGA